MINEFVDPGHFYSVIPSITEEYNNSKVKFLDLDFNKENHLDILNDISNYLSDFDNQFGHKNVIERQNDCKYTLLNGTFDNIIKNFVLY